MSEVRTPKHVQEPIVLNIRPLGTSGSPLYACARICIYALTHLRGVPALPGWAPMARPRCCRTPRALGCRTGGNGESGAGKSGAAARGSAGAQAGTGRAQAALSHSARPVLRGWERICPRSPGHGEPRVPRVGAGPSQSVRFVPLAFNAGSDLVK